MASPPRYDRHRLMRCRLISSALTPLLLTACIPYQTQRHDTPAPPPRLDDSATVDLAEAEPVWTAQQVVANATSVIGATYIVQPGDTLRGIGNRTGAGAEMIAKANALAPPYVIKSGQKLTIPAGRYHAVAQGETGIAIAAAYGVPWSRMVDVNGLTEPFALRRGQRLLLPDEAPRGTPSMEERAAAFQINIDDVLTGGQPAAAEDAPVAVAKASPRPIPSNIPAATPARLTGNFIWPARGKILSRFGPGASGARNNGIDIAVPAGTPIHATADGVVAYAGDKVAVFGGLVLITHGSGWVSAYGHASRVNVVRGQKVAKGDVIGLSGDSGYASQPKLHFELRKDRAPVNPLAHLPAS